MHRFYIDPENISKDYITSKNQELVNQLSKVLRAKEGSRYGFFDNSGSEQIGQLVELTKKSAKFLIIDSYSGRHEPRRRVVMCLALLKADKFDWALQKAVELGVSEIRPFVAEHSIVRSLTSTKMDRIKQIAKEATEQCGGCRLAEIGPVVSFESLLRFLKERTGEKYIAHEQEIHQALPASGTGDIYILIGPEGGFSPAEISLAKDSGIKAVSLGNRVLRAETAAVCAAARLLSD